MNVKKLLINTLMIGAVAMAPMTMSSCDDDDDGNGNGGSPSVEQGEADLQFTGAETDSLNGMGATFFDTTQSAGGVTQETLTISFADTAGNSVSVNFTAAGDNASLNTGKYQPLDPQDPSNKFVTVSFNVNGTPYTSIESGNVELLTKSESNAAAKFNDLEVSGATSDDAITVTGQINAESR